MTDRFKDALDEWPMNSEYRFQNYADGDVWVTYHAEAIKEALTLATEAEKPKGEISDGYHTFNELYDHRHSLFCALTKSYSEKSWKSKLHSDGTMFDGWFIAGIETGEGNATYHLPISWWADFDIDELPNAPKWDGHTSADVIVRIRTLSPSKFMMRDGHGD